ncbi:MAG: hypothetical protein OXF78_11700 [Rhodospirillales bacterium]|nr:hypothetical protein [Rhodospirillales bacterium]
MNELVRDKLTAIGRGDDEQLASQIVDRLFKGALTGTDEQGDQKSHIEHEQKLVLRFTSAAVDRIAKFADELRELLAQVIQEISEQLSKRMLAGYQRDWSKRHLASKTHMDQFRSNLEDRWGKGFNYLRMLIELPRDIGTDFHRRHVAAGRRVAFTSMRHYACCTSVHSRSRRK